MEKIKLAIVVPCFNEEGVVQETNRILQEKLHSLLKSGEISNESFILFIDDGSKDNTYKILKKLSTLENNVVQIRVLKLSSNFGHQNALFAGYSYVVGKCDCTISIDCDLQDDIGVFDEFLKKFRENKEVVYGVRKSREKDTFFKRKTAKYFYKIFNFLVGNKIKLIENHADYRLLSNRVLKELISFKEKNLFLRGIIPTLGFRSDVVYYHRNRRFAGETKYPLKKMLSFAWSGITGFSVAPLRIVTFIGLFILLLSFLFGCYVFYVTLFLHSNVQGWSSIAILISFFGGMQMFAIGIIGEYIGKIFQEVKNRPNFIVEEIFNET